MPAICFDCLSANCGFVDDTDARDSRKVFLYLQDELVEVSGGDLTNAVNALVQEPLEVSTDYTITQRFIDIAVDASGGDVNIYLPALASGNFYRIKKVNTTGGDVIIHADGSDLIDDSATHSLVGSQRPSTSFKGFPSQWRKV